MSTRKRSKAAQIHKILSKLTMGDVADEQRDALLGLMAGGEHASHMHRAGKLSDDELADYTLAAAAQTLEHLSNDEYDRMMKDGDLDLLHSLTGFDDGEEPEEVESQRHAIVTKVAVNMLALAAQRGILKPTEALEAIQAYAALPEDAADEQEAIARLLSDSERSGSLLGRPVVRDDDDEDQITDDELESALRGEDESDDADPELDEAMRDDDPDEDGAELGAMLTSFYGRHAR